MRYNVHEEDKCVHLFLGYRINHSEYDVLDTIVEWMHSDDECERAIAKRFVEANKDNEEVMEYLWLEEVGDNKE